MDMSIMIFSDRIFIYTLFILFHNRSFILIKGFNQ